MTKIKISILGSTGSIGTQALAVINENSDRFEVVALASGGSSPKSCDLFQQQVAQFLSPKYQQNVALSSRDGFDAVVNLADRSKTGADVVLNGIAGNIGLMASLKAVSSGAHLALANKESLVVGGALFKNYLNDDGNLLDIISPVDSEHSAIWQCFTPNVERLLLTASGGPFRGYTKTELANVTKAEALNHPTWSMGQLVTINSATLMNKALELIEAVYLFGTPPDKIDVTVHPQSIVHSGVQYKDGSTIFQASPPSMELPIATAINSLTCKPEHINNAIITPLNWQKTHDLHFEPVDNNVFPALEIARECIKKGPLYSVIMNIVNEKSVYDFLNDKIGFTQIMQNVTDALEQFNPNEYTSNPIEPTVDEILNLLNTYNFASHC